MRIKLPQRRESFASRGTPQFQAPRLSRDNAASEAFGRMGALAQDIALKEKRYHMRAVAQRARVDVTTESMNRLNEFRKLRGTSLIENPNAIEEATQGFEGATESILSKYDEEERRAIAPHLSDINLGFTKGVSRHFANEEESFRTESYKASVANNIAQSSIDMGEIMEGSGKQKWKHYGDMAIEETLVEAQRTSAGEERAEEMKRDVYNDLAIKQVGTATSQGRTNLAKTMLRYYKGKIDGDLHQKLAEKINSDANLRSDQKAAQKAVDMDSYEKREKYLRILPPEQQKRVRPMVRQQLNTKRAALNFEEKVGFNQAAALKRELIEMEIQGGSNIAKDIGAANAMASKRIELKNMMEKLNERSKKYIHGMGAEKEVTEDDPYTERLLFKAYMNGTLGDMDLAQYASKLKPSTLRTYGHRQEQALVGKTPEIVKNIERKAKEVVEAHGLNHKKGGRETYEALMRWADGVREVTGKFPTEAEWQTGYKLHHKIEGRGWFSFAESLEDLDELTYNEAKDKYGAAMKAVENMLEETKKRAPTDQEVLETLKKLAKAAKEK